MSSWQVRREDVRLLEAMVRRLIEVSTIRPGQRVHAGTNTTGRSVLCPGYNGPDRAVYPAFWVRDPAWVAESGWIPAEEVWGWITLMTETMRGPQPWRLASGGVVLPYAIADHINLDGRPVYYPGTYAADETQGPPWGKYPPHDDQYWLTFTADVYVRMTGDAQAFGRSVPTPMGPRPLWQVCAWAHDAFPVDEQSGLCVASDDPGEHIVDWGYNDTVTKTGKLLFPSLLQLESALKLAALFEAYGDVIHARRYRHQADALRAAIVPTFYEAAGPDEGWLLSATGIGRKPDVWGTALAVHRRYLDEGVTLALARELARGFRERTTVLAGQVRHLPTTVGAWEQCQALPGYYQNGAYWGYPSGWYMDALTLVDESAAAAMFAEYWEAMRQGWTPDVRACAWECVNPALGHYQNPGYLTTLALPYVALKSRGLLEGVTP